MRLEETGIFRAMIFIPARNGGASLVPEEYSTPQDLENGAKVLAAGIYKLANEDRPVSSVDETLDLLS